MKNKDRFADKDAMRDEMKAIDLLVNGGRLSDHRVSQLKKQYNQLSDAYGESDMRELIIEFEKRGRMETANLMRKEIEAIRSGARHRY